MTTSTTLPRAYHTILRSLPVSSPVKARHPLHKFVRDVLFKGTGKNGALTKIQLLQNEELARFLKHQKEYIRLLERYNPSLMGALDGEELARRTANRVGLQVPEEWKVGGKKE